MMSIILDMLRLFLEHSRVRYRGPELGREMWAGVNYAGMCLFVLGNPQHLQTVVDAGE